MYYVSVKDIFGLDLSSVNISDNEHIEIALAVSEGGSECFANYLNTQNLPLRDRILEGCGMDTDQRITVQKDTHRTLNGEGKEIYTGTRWVGRTEQGNSVHEVYQDIASDEKYDGISEETGTTIRPTNRQFLKHNPSEDNLNSDKFSKLEEE